MTSFGPGAKFQMSGFDPVQMGFIGGVIVESDWSFFKAAQEFERAPQGATTDICCLIKCCWKSRQTAGAVAMTAQCHTKRKVQHYQVVKSLQTWNLFVMMRTQAWLLISLSLNVSNIHWLLPPAGMENIYRAHVPCFSAHRFNGACKAGECFKLSCFHLEHIHSDMVCLLFSTWWHNTEQNVWIKTFVLSILCLQLMHRETFGFCSQFWK